QDSERVNLVEAAWGERKCQKISTDHADLRKVRRQFPCSHDRVTQVDANYQERGRFGGDSQVAAHPAARIEHHLALEIRIGESRPAAKCGAILFRTNDSISIPLQAVGRLGAALIVARHRCCYDLASPASALSGPTALVGRFVTQALILGASRLLPFFLS